MNVKKMQEEDLQTLSIGVKRSRNLYDTTVLFYSVAFQALSSVSVSSNLDTLFDILHSSRKTLGGVRSLPQMPVSSQKKNPTCFAAFDRQTLFRPLWRP
jgi:hypothetical protein